MKVLPGILLAAALAVVAPASVQAAPKDPVASAAVQREFDDFVARFRAALKADDSAAVAGMSQLPFMNDKSIRDAAQFREKIYKPYFTAKARACIQRGKAIYSRDGDKNDSYGIFCGDDIFTFTKTPAGFVFTDIGVND